MIDDSLPMSLRIFRGAKETKLPELLDGDDTDRTRAVAQQAFRLGVDTGLAIAAAHAASRRSTLSIIRYVAKKTRGRPRQ